MTRLHLYRTLLLIGACSCLLAGCATNGSRTQKSARPSTLAPFEYTMDETYPLPATGMIRLRSEDAKVTISGSDRDDVRVEVHYRISAARDKLARFTYLVSAAQTEGELVVTEERETGSRNFTYDEQIHAIKIELPRNAHVTVREEDGTCAINDITGRIHLTMDDGAIRLENCSGEITVSMDDGTLTQTNCARLKYEPR